MKSLTQKIYEHGKSNAKQRTNQYIYSSLIVFVPLLILLFYEDYLNFEFELKQWFSWYFRIILLTLTIYFVFLFQAFIENKKFNKIKVKDFELVNNIQQTLLDTFYEQNKLESFYSAGWFLLIIFAVFLTKNTVTILTIILGLLVFVLINLGCFVSFYYIFYSLRLANCYFVSTVIKYDKWNS